MPFDNPTQSERTDAAQAAKANAAGWATPFVPYSMGWTRDRARHTTCPYCPAPCTKAHPCCACINNRPGCAA